MDKINQLQSERSALMSGTRTHTEWCKAMERLAEISSEILILKNEGAIVIGQPPIATQEERAQAKLKLIRMNQFKKEISHAAI